MLKVLHSSSGRVRLRYDRLRADISLCSSVSGHLLHSEGITAVRCNPKCSSLIIRYNPDRVTISGIISTILNCSCAKQEQKSVCHASCCCSDVKDGALLLSRKAEFTGLTVVTAASFISKKVFGRALAGTVFSPLWFATAFFALPLVYSALKEIAGTRRIGLESFLGTGVTAALLSGETMTALEILWVNSGAELMQGYVTEKSRKSIKNILDLTAKTAYVLKDGMEIELPVERIAKGDTVIVRTGEKISVDGEIFRGEAMVNEAPINGRQDLIYKTKGGLVFAGTYVQEGLVYILAERAGDDTYLARILREVESSLENKAPIELEADRLAKKLVRLGFLMTFGTWIITRSLYRTLSVMLVMTCPCATALSASSAVSAAIGNAASKGVLIKGGRYLEDAGEQKSFCFDKTGTITTDIPEITDIYALKGYTQEQVLLTAYTAELHNRHPMAAAVRKAAELKGIPKPGHAVCETILGMGVAADTPEGTVCVGNKKLMNRFSIKTGGGDRKAAQYVKEGKSVLYVAAESGLIGLLAVTTGEKEGVAEMIEFLRRDGVENLILVTGDEEQAAKPMAEKLGFDECHCSVLPGRKAEIIKEIQKQHKVAMIGDGINDVLALAQSDLGIAMGAAGSDVAVEAADIALVDDDLHKLVFIRQLSKKTKEIVHQNFAIATSTNLGGAALGAMGLLNPVMAGLLHIAHTGGILANSSRLLKYDGEKNE